MSVLDITHNPSIKYLIVLFFHLYWFLGFLAHVHGSGTLFTGSIKPDKF